MTTETMTHEQAPSRMADLLTLTKVRVNTLVVVTTAGGYWLGSAGDTHPLLLLNVCVGTALVAGGAAALNQISERDVDGLMERTRRRPVAAARLPVGEAVGSPSAWPRWASRCSGSAPRGSPPPWRWPRSCRTRSSTRRSASHVALDHRRVRARALPLLIGWAAARGTVFEPTPWCCLRWILLAVPHILAVGWMYRDDYARSGLPVLAVIDRTGAISGRQSVLWSASLIPISLLPSMPAIGLTGRSYVIGALVLGVIQFVMAVRFARDRSRSRARQLFYTTLLYLPLLWLLLGLGRR